MTKPQFLAADVANLEAHIHALMQAYPDLAEDEDLRRDCIEGETDAFSVLSRLVDIEREADSMSRAIKQRQDELAARKNMADRRKEAMRTLMLRVMKAAGIQKAPLVEATVSVTKGRQSVEIIDETLLPKWAIRIRTEPDKRLILERLAANKNVKGARLKDGDETISVRVA
jgi:hypothetical protein